MLKPKPHARYEASSGLSKKPVVGSCRVEAGDGLIVVMGIVRCKWKRLMRLMEVDVVGEDDEM
jgi:hypothetical protein